MTTEETAPDRSSLNYNQRVSAPDPSSSYESGQVRDVGGANQSGSTTSVRKRQGLTSRRSPNRQGSHRNSSGNSADILRRVRFFQLSGELTLTYVDVARAEDRSVRIFNQDPELLKTYGTDIDRQTLSRHIDTDVAVEIVRRLESDEKIASGTADAFSQWLNILPRATETSASTSSDLETPHEGETHAFFIWYPEPRSEGHVLQFSPQDEVPGLSHLQEQLSIMEGVPQNSGWLCLMTSQRDIEHSVHRDVEPSLNNVESVLIGDHPSMLFYVAPPVADDPYLAQQTSAIFSSEWDWVRDEQPMVDVFQPYVTPFSNRDTLSPRVVQIWSPVFRSAQRAENHVARIGTHFGNLIESRYRLYYDVNLSSAPVPGIYSHFRPV